MRLSLREATSNDVLEVVGLFGEINDLKYKGITNFNSDQCSEPWSRSRVKRVRRITGSDNTQNRALSNGTVSVGRQDLASFASGAGPGEWNKEGHGATNSIRDCQNLFARQPQPPEPRSL